MTSSVTWPARMCQTLPSPIFASVIVSIGTSFGFGRGLLGLG
jgi:hypothetical protein